MSEEEKVEKEKGFNFFVWFKNKITWKNFRRYLLNPILTGISISLAGYTVRRVVQEYYVAKK
eukprot:gene12154-5644_t